MANILWKHINLCFSHFKCLPSSLPPPSSPPHPPQNPNLSSLPPDFSSLYNSDRFFFSSPGQSNSILDSSENPPPATLSGADATGVAAVQTDSPDPYLDFRKSMQEMVEAREYTDVEGNLDFLHELLLCYLMLNPKHTHKFIVGAFSDLLISLMDTSASYSRRKKVYNDNDMCDKCPDSVCDSSNGSESVLSEVIKA